MSLFEDDYVYEVIPIDDSKTNNQSSYQDSLLSGNNDGTIPLSQGHALCGPNFDIDFIIENCYDCTFFILNNICLLISVNVKNILCVLH
jgi:hypothetical protein